MPGKRKDKISQEEQPPDLNDDPLFLKKVADSNPAIIYVIDLNKVEFVYINKMVEELLGHDETYVFAQGKNIFREMIHPDHYHSWMEHIRSISKLTDTQKHELEIQLHVNGKGYRWFRLCDKVFSRNEAGLPMQMIGIASDITDKKIQEDRIVTELRTFNSITSTDYKETLQTLYTNLEYIVSKDSRNLGETSRANIRKAQGAIQKMKLLTDDINSYLQLYDMGISKEMIDPNAIIANLLEGMKRKIEEANAEFEITALPMILADPFLFSKLMHYLIDNAIKFGKTTVHPIIRIRYSKAGEMNSMPHPLKNTPCNIVSVSDNGIGFPKEESERIFELLYRLQDKSKSKGSGVGLAVCRKIMSMHGGLITAESELATGATFNCYFPLN